MYDCKRAYRVAQYAWQQQQQQQPFRSQRSVHSRRSDQTNLFALFWDFSLVNNRDSQ